jgi:hypothetical protein
MLFMQFNGSRGTKQMNSKAILFCASLLGVGALLAQDGPPPGGPGGHRGPGGPGGPGFGGPPVTGAPFSATKTDTHTETLSDGNVISDTRTESIARDTNGRFYSQSTITTPGGTTKTMITIFDPVAGFVARLNPAAATAVKETLPTPPSGTPPTPPAWPKPPADANAPQAVKTDLGAATFGSISANGTRTTITIPAGAMGNTNPIVETSEVWISPVLKIPVKTIDTDPLHGTSSMLMSNITTTDPDPSLFQIPAAYTVTAAPAHQGPGGPDGHGPGPGGPPPPPEN